METVEDVHRLGAFLPDTLQIGLPHVRADERDFGDDLLAHGGEESLERFDGPFSANPEQTGDADIDSMRSGMTTGPRPGASRASGRSVTTDFPDEAIIEAPADPLLTGTRFRVVADQEGTGGSGVRKRERIAGTSRGSRREHHSHADSAGDDR